ncbi:MAG: carbohydrate-binding family 9-like protein [Bryobacteraceae bacterium]
MRRLTLLLSLFAAAAFADGPGRIESKYSSTDFPLTANPDSRYWKDVKGVFAEKDNLGKTTTGHRSEIRSRWTDKNIYFLFINPYEELYLIPKPSTATETNKLWEHDAAEVFIGADFDNINQYREYQVSPQGEWVDLDIDRDKPLPEGGWLWNSGFKVKARIDKDKKVWYGEMQIPIESIDKRPPKPGNEMRVNFYRFQGPPPDRKAVAWQPTGNRSNHTPKAFGRLVLVK